MENSSAKYFEALPIKVSYPMGHNYMATVDNDLQQSIVFSVNCSSFGKSLLFTKAMSLLNCILRKLTYNGNFILSAFFQFA